MSTTREKIGDNHNVPRIYSSENFTFVDSLMPLIQSGLVDALQLELDSAFPGSGAHDMTELLSTLSNREGNSIMHLACLHQKFEILRYLLLNNSTFNINTTNKENKTLLNVAAESGCFRSSEMLLRKGADINIACKITGKTPLMSASMNGHDKIVQLLINAGAIINLINDNGFTPINAAAGEGHTETVRVLLEAGADINIPNIYGCTPLNSAASENHHSIVQLLIDSKKCDINGTNIYGWSSLKLAASEGHEEVVRILLDNNARVDICDEEGFSPLHASAKEGHATITEMLIDAGADINHMSARAWTPLNSAVSEDKWETTKVLLEAGADFDIANGYGCKPLNYAISKEFVGCLYYLIEQGVPMDTASIPMRLVLKLNQFQIQMENNASHSQLAEKQSQEIAQLKYEFKIQQELLAAEILTLKNELGRMRAKMSSSP